MKSKIILLIAFLNFFSVNNSFSMFSDGVDVEMFLMRKGNSVRIVLVSNGDALPTELGIERKSTAPLSTYRKVLTVNGDQLLQLKTEKKLILEDLYPESRQLDSYYRVKFVTAQGVIRTMPAVYLEKASNENAITFGDHKKDETMFETEEEKKVISFQDYGVVFNVKSNGTKVLITIGGGKSLNGSWFIERKSSKPLSSFRRIKVISEEDKQLTMQGEHVFIDKYPESRKLDVYYRLLVALENGEFIEFPSVLLPRTSNGN